MVQDINLHAQVQQIGMAYTQTSLSTWEMFEGCYSIENWKVQMLMSSPYVPPSQSRQYIFKGSIAEL